MVAKTSLRQAVRATPWEIILILGAEVEGGSIGRFVWITRFKAACSLLILFVLRAQLEAWHRVGALKMWLNEWVNEWSPSIVRGLLGTSWVTGQVWDAKWQSIWMQICVQWKRSVRSGSPIIPVLPLAALATCQVFIPSLFPPELTAWSTDPWTQWFMFWTR